MSACLSCFVSLTLYMNNWPLRWMAASSEDLDQRLHRLWSVGFTAAGLLEWDKALECFEKIGRHEDHPYALHALFASTLLYGRDGRHEDKRRVAERAATMLRRKLGRCRRREVDSWAAVGALPI